jgi:hypothetical protein
VAAEADVIYLRHADCVIRFLLVDGRINVAELAHVFDLDRGLVFDGNSLPKTRDGLRYDSHGSSQ